MIPCDHLRAGTWPFKVELVIDQALYFTEALVSCVQCGERYLLELLDERGRQGLFRISMPGRKESDALLHDLSRGSCDVNRATAEVASVRSASPLLPTLLLIDPQGPRILALVDSAGRKLPSGSARSLPRDGSWFDQLRV
jgi:hypothetical protein